MSAKSIRNVLSDPYRWAKAIAFVAMAYLTFVVILPSTLATWEETHMLGTFQVTPALRTQVVETLADKVTRRYVDARRAEHMAAALRQAEREGRFTGVTSPVEFARLLTSELVGSSKDQHLQVVFVPGDVPDAGDSNFPVRPEPHLSLPARLVDRLGRAMASFGVDEVTQSDDGIGYLRLGGFVRPYLSAEKFAAAMDRLAGTKALIIDLRANGGGNRDSVALLASYFFDEPTHLSDVVAPRSGERLSMWTRRDVAGRRYGATRPVYILTSRATFSAAEDFAYAMQTRKRAVVVGEPTRGGAHPTAPFRLGAHFLVVMPVAESISPVTHTNWEGAGVQPDIAAPAPDARRVATAAILERRSAMAQSR